MEVDDIMADTGGSTSANTGSSSKKRKITYRNEFDLHRPVTTVYIDEMFSSLKIFCQSLITETQQGTETNEFDEMVKTISNATSVDAILNACAHLELVYANDATRLGIKCRTCFNAYESTGFFKFPGLYEVHALGKSNKPVLSAKFKGLRTIIRHHLLSTTHGQNARRVLRCPEDDPATIFYVEQKVDNIKLFLESLLKRPSAEVTSSDKKPQSVVSKATSISEVLNSCTDLALMFESQTTEMVDCFDTIACVPCRSTILNKNPTSKSKLGLFTYDCSLGFDFGGPKNNQKPQPLKFRQLKDTISDHVRSKVHCHAVGVPYIPSQKEIASVEQNEATGMILGKLAYKAIVKYQSKLSFEDEVTFLADIGVEVGDINHGVDYVDKLFPHLYSVLKEQTMTTLHHPVSPFLQTSPFVVFADKITPYGTTMQIIGIIIFKEGKNTPITLDVLPVKHKIQNGAALAKDIVDTLYKFYTPESAKQLYVGSSFDGQYVKLKVPQEILKLLGFKVDVNTPLEELNEVLFHSYSWDPAHLLELACGDVKKSRLHEWVDKTEQTIVTVNRGNTYGKPYLRLIEEARQLDLVLLRPGSFSDTRFSSYKHRVLNRFLNNYPMLYNTHSQDKDSDLNLFNNCQFCLRLSALVDIFELIGVTSAQIQSSELLPWECDDIIEDCIKKLKQMASCISSNVLDYGGEWKRFSEAVEEITKKGLFKGKPVLIQKTVYYLTRSNSIKIARDDSFKAVILRVKTEIQFYVNSLAESLQQRYSKHHKKKSLVTARDSFSRALILEQTSDDVPESFVQYCELARKWGFIDSSVTQDALNFQYRLFCSKVKEGYHQRIQLFGLHVPECFQYWEIMSLDDEREKMAAVLNLLLTSMVRNKSECIAESIGSMMKTHLEKRCRLSDENLGMEIFLHFNGPKPNRECNGLVRKANKKVFGNEKMHFHRVSQPSELKFWEDGSKVITKIHSHSGRIVVPDDGVRNDLNFLSSVSKNF